MSADFCLQTTAIEFDKTPNWIEPTDEHIGKFIEYEGLPEEERDNVRDRLKDAVAKVKDAFEGNASDACCLWYQDHNLKVIATGGMSWGDPPTDTYEAITMLENAEMLGDMGFK